VLSFRVDLKARKC